MWDPSRRVFLGTGAGSYKRKLRRKFLTYQRSHLPCCREPAAAGLPGSPSPFWVVFTCFGSSASVTRGTSSAGGPCWLRLTATQLTSCSLATYPPSCPSPISISAILAVVWCKSSNILFYTSVLRSGSKTSPFPSAWYKAAKRQAPDSRGLPPCCCWCHGSGQRSCSTAASPKPQPAQGQCLGGLRAPHLGSELLPSTTALLSSRSLLSASSCGSNIFSPLTRQISSNKRLATCLSARLRASW